MLELIYSLNKLVQITRIRQASAREASSRKSLQSVTKKKHSESYRRLGFQEPSEGFQETTQKFQDATLKVPRNHTKRSKKILKKLQGNHSKPPRKTQNSSQEVTQKVPRNTNIYTQIWSHGVMTP